MTPDQIDRVRRIVAAIDAHADFAPRFYGRLFDLAPQTADMFSDMGAQQRKLADELAALVSMLEDLPSLDARARALGDRHRGYGVRASHYRLARTVMTETIAEILGEDFTEEDQAAWDRATSLVTELMQAV